MNLLMRRTQGDHFFEKGDEVATGMARGGLAVNATRGGIQGRIKGEGSVADIFKTMTFGAARAKAAAQGPADPAPEWQSSRRYRTPPHAGRFDVKPNNIGGLGFEIGIIAGHVAFQPVWLQTGFVPGAVHSVFADTKSRGKFAATPVSRSILRLLSSSREYPGPQGRGQHGGRLPGMEGVQSIDSGSKEAVPSSD